MKPTETVVLTEYVKAACPQQAKQMGEYTPDAWHDLLGDLELADCREAVIMVARRQPFVAPADIRAEVRRIREDRLARTQLPAPSPELAEQPGRYVQAIRAGVQRLADGFAPPPAITGAPREDGPPDEYVAARKVLPDAEPPKPDLQALAREQAAEARRERTGETR